MDLNFQKLAAFYTKVSDFQVMAASKEARSHWQISFQLLGQSLVPAYPEENLEASFREGLWQSTCLEVFEFDQKSSAYVEWNFSPSGDWAFFAFSEYRKRNLAFERKSPISWSWSQEKKQRNLDLKLPRCFEQSKLQLTAVIDWGEKGLDYYAFEHPADKPDFHLKF